MKRRNISFLVVLLIFIIMSCNNNLGIENEIYKDTDVSQSEEIVLGVKRDNPFIVSDARSILAEDIEPNYVYFRIRTDNIENIRPLETVLGELNTVPLDYEIIEGGCTYSENLGSEEYTPWFYSMTTVSVYETIKQLGETDVIDRMYISEEDLSRFTELDDIDADVSARVLWINYKKARPTGYVYFYDEVKKCNIPLGGVKVTVSQWCHVKSVYTNEKGYYDIGENFTSCWQNTANVKITFETNKDSIYPGWSVVKASYNAGDKNISSLSGNNIYLKKRYKTRYVWNFS